MNELIPTAGNGLTMTSLEISALVEKRHDNVRRTIETLAEQGVIEFPQIEEIPTATKPTKAYRFTGERGKRDSIIVVAQLCPEFTARLVDRWQELEARMVQSAIPQTLPEALRLAAEAIERNEKLALENKAQAEVLDRISAGKDSLTLTQAAKVLGVKLSELTTRMHAEGWIYRQNSSWVGYDYRIKSGTLSYKEANYTDEKTGMACVKPYCHVTPKGLVKLAQMLGVQHLGDGGQGRKAA